MTGRIYALLGVEREERRVLGVGLVGDTLRRDVQQVVVNFRNHRFLVPAPDEAATRWELKKRTFDHLIAAALQQLIVAREKREKLTQEQKLLRRKLKTLEAAHWGMGPLLSGEEPSQVDVPAVEKRIGEVEAELARIGTKGTNLDDYLAGIVATLNRPEEHLRISPFSVTLNLMAVKVKEGSDSQASTLRLDEVTSSAGERMIVLLVSLPRGEIRPPRDLLKEARRYLR